MPIKKSAKKALKQNIKRRKINIKAKNKMKSLIKELNEFIEKLGKSSEKPSLENIKELREKLRFAYKAIDKASKKRVIKKNTAARKKSKLAKKVNSIQKI